MNTIRFSVWIFALDVLQTHMYIRVYSIPKFRWISRRKHSSIINHIYCIIDIWYLFSERNANSSIKNLIERVDILSVSIVSLSTLPFFNFVCVHLLCTCRSEIACDRYGYTWCRWAWIFLSNSYCRCSGFFSWSSKNETIFVVLRNPWLNSSKQKSEWQRKTGKMQRPEKFESNL